MQNIKIYGNCPQCGGTGYRSVYNAALPPIQVDIPCVYCNETGIIEPYGLDSDVLDAMTTSLSDITDKINDLSNKLDDILETLNP